MPSLRYRALEQIALLSASDPFVPDADLDLISSRSIGSLGRIRTPQSELTPEWTRSEIESTLALCKAAISTTNGSTAITLAYRLSELLTRSLDQNISLSYFVLNLGLSPWHILSYNVTSALLSLSQHHPQTSEVVDKAIWNYSSIWVSHAESVKSLVNEETTANKLLERSSILMTSFLGFANSLSEATDLKALSDKAGLLSSWQKCLFGDMLEIMNGTVATIRNSHNEHRHLYHWKAMTEHYDTVGQPLGGVTVHEAFARMLSVLCASQIRPNPNNLLNDLFLWDRQNGFQLPESSTLDPGLNTLANDEWEKLDHGVEIVSYGSIVELQLVSAIKGYVIQAKLFCALASGNTGTLAKWLLESPFSDPTQMAAPTFSCVLLKSLAVLSRQSELVATRMSQELPVLLGQGVFQGMSVIVCAEALSVALRQLHPDTTITTLYNLSNLITASNAIDPNPTESPLQSGSSLPLQSSDSDDRSRLYSSTIHSIIQVIICVAVASGDEKIINLALSMLVQKIGLINSSVDALIISETAVLSGKSAPGDFKRHLDVLEQVCHDAFLNSKQIIIKAVAVARNYLSMMIKRESELFEVYLLHMINSITSKGEVQDENRTAFDMELSAREIAEILSPLASLVSANSNELMVPSSIEGLPNLVRDAWYNIVVHGFSYKSIIGKAHLSTLQVLAYHSPPLIAKDKAGKIESDIELNTVLRRGEGSDHTSEHKSYLSKILPVCAAAIKTLSYSEVIFLKTAHLMETLRARSGNCTEVLTYFSDSRLQLKPPTIIESRAKPSPLGFCMQAVATEAVATYVSQTLSSSSLSFSSYHLANQLATVMSLCCHRIQSIQSVAITSADSIIASVPSSLCQQKSLFTLLDLMTLLWDSCLERETDEYGWKSSFTTPYAELVVELPENFVSRQETLHNFHKCATRWMQTVIDMAPLDVKELLQAYLSDPKSEVSPGHISFGRSFAIEMGSLIPSSDPRLKSINAQRSSLGINSASDFLAQYTNSQRYQVIGLMINSNQLGLWSDPDKAKSEKSLKDLEDKLEKTYNSITQKDGGVSWDEVAVSLHHAGAFLSGARNNSPAIVRYLVRIPFAVFTKESIKQGIALWSAVMKSNARMESRIIVEIAERWEHTMTQKVGLFDSSLQHPDPFFEKQEFAPSCKTTITKSQSQVYGMISPHLRLVRFLSSHFRAIHLCTPQLRRVYIRLVHKALDGLLTSADHPLVRECHLQLVLLGFDILQNTPDFLNACRWRFLDRVLSGGLAWFTHFPRWSFGGNRLQVKAEVELIERLKIVLAGEHFSKGIIPEALKSIESKRRLFDILLEDELSRLLVWLYPLHNEKRTDFLHHPYSKLARTVKVDFDVEITTAWMYNPVLAIRMSQRFSSPAVQELVRELVRNHTEKVLDDPAALELLLGAALSVEDSRSLNYLLYWKAVNPITAASYLLPAYGNNPFVIQYSLRALDSHSVDITFFYVPQIVQTLRYDDLGYAERYILEAGMVSQRFVHQIIWNMKANMFKDEDSQIPDGIKPALDRVLDHLVHRFTPEDESFYQREFSFFNEVTNISGQLKPFIKKSKPEKKQKIDEELRKIKLKTGVYLPSNPDGVVIGIDRHSGRPLQSHAKAPFMATFRIRKPIDQADMEADNLDYGEETKEDGAVMYYQDLWQSAIFKVGDDCRQDVLVLQLISCFRNVFNDVGLDVFVYPYRVTATAPGCGVIDVLPNSLSRDMLGREAVNGLYAYFVSKYGGEDSIRFQVARGNFVKSMAAYSIISHLLQLKDRHNGNIMIDDAGHIIHIDFGFCFETAPGGIKFERAPFKLTVEMIAVMGGSELAQPYVWFEELCVKAFLAVRQHSEHFLQLVNVMLGSGLPCFGAVGVSPLLTIKNFRDRFALHLSEMEAAEHVRDLIRKSSSSRSTKTYDYFQSVTNGIPY